MAGLGTEKVWPGTAKELSLFNKGLNSNPFLGRKEIGGRLNTILKQNRQARGKVTPIII